MMDGMKQMDVPPAQELYPSLMNMPAELTPEERAKLKNLADSLISEGNTIISSGFAKLAAANVKDDTSAIAEAAEEIRRGQAMLDNGLAARQTLENEENPADGALKWFKREMKLDPPVKIEQPHGFFGLSWFHYITMVTLVAFSAAMIWMYFHKMRRAGALVARLSGDSVDVALPGVATVRSSPGTELIPVNPDLAPTKSNSWTGQLRVSEVFDETPNVKTFRLTDPSGGRLPFNYLPGQFATITIEQDGRQTKRSYTIASAPTKRDYCEITVKREPKGIVSCYLHEHVRPGDSLQITAPSGRFTFTGENTRGIVLIAGGVGVTPLMSVVRYLTDRAWPGDIYFLFACKTEKDIIFHDEIEFLVRRHSNFHVRMVLEEPSAVSGQSYSTGRISKEILAECIPDIMSHLIHICGPPQMMESVKQIMAELGVPDEHIHTEIFIGPQSLSKSDHRNDPERGMTAVNFVRSKKVAIVTPDKTVLEASEDIGVDIDYSCRAGYCGICKTKQLEGEVEMAVDDALTEEEKAENLILACQAKPKGDIAVDA